MARVSTQDQKLELQIDELTRQGCGLIFKKRKPGRLQTRVGVGVGLAVSPPQLWKKQSWQRFQPPIFK